MKECLTGTSTDRGEQTEVNRGKTITSHHITWFISHIRYLSHNHTPPKADMTIHRWRHLVINVVWDVATLVSPSFPLPWIVNAFTSIIKTQLITVHLTLSKRQAVDLSSIIFPLSPSHGFVIHTRFHTLILSYSLTRIRGRKEGSIALLAQLLHYCITTPSESANHQ